jgi:phage baseplate assembly protein W
MFNYSDIEERPYVNLGSNGDIAIDYDVEAIENQIVNILTIPPYSIPGRPAFATSLYLYLHEPDDEITRSAVETEVENLLETYVDRIKVVNVECKGIKENFSSKAIVVDIEYVYAQDRFLKRVEIA